MFVPTGVRDLLIAAILYRLLVVREPDGIEVNPRGPGFVFTSLGALFCTDSESGFCPPKIGCKSGQIWPQKLSNWPEN